MIAPQTAAPAPPAVELISLSKSYGSRTILHDLSLRVRAGSLFGFLGPNGAGKTTAIRILLGLLRADGGAARVLGRETGPDGADLRAEIGYLPGDVRFYDAMTGRNLLNFLADARGGRGADEIDRLARLFDLELAKRIRDYSRGMKQKLGLMQALMHRPQILILDEPTTALDPLVQQTLYDELRRVVAQGRTVLFSSHALSEVEQLCDEVAILRAGRLVEQERIDVLRRRAVRAVELTFDPAAPPRTPPPPELTLKLREPGRWMGAWRGPTPPLIAWLALNPVRDVVIAPPDLEDLFMTYYNERSEAAA